MHRALPRLPLFMAILTCLLVPAAVTAGEFLYTGDVLPTSDGWTVHHTNSYINGGGITSTIVADGGSNTWRLNDNSTTNRCAVQNLVLGDVSFNTGVTIAARVKCTSDTSSSYNLGITNGNVGGMYLAIKRASLVLTNLTGTEVASYSADGQSDYHRYYLTVLNAIGNDNGSAQWKVYRDGVVVITYGGAGTADTFDGFSVGHNGTNGKGTWYFDWIAANNGGAFSPAQWDPMPTGPPAAPTLISPADGATITTQNVPVQWSGPIHSSYEVHVNTTNVPGDADAWDSGQISSAADYCSAGPLPDGSYYVFVRIANAVGWSPWSAGRAFNVSYQAPVIVTPSIAVPNENATVNVQQPAIQWEGGPHDGYEVHINTTNVPTDGSVWDSGDTSSSADSCDAGPLANGAYYAFVRVRDAFGWSAWSAGRQFNVSVTGQPYKKGWVMLIDDQAYNLELLSKAREYHVNHIQISHDIIMYAWQPINDINRRNRINELIDVAHQNGVTEVTVWTHEIQFNDLPAQYFVGGKVNLDDPGFWQWMDSEYETLFQVLPNLDGLIFTFSENFEGADFNDRGSTIHTGKSPTDTFAQAIETLWNVCNRHNKSLYIRTWLGAGPDRWARDAILRNDPRIWMMSKGVGAADWNAIYDDYDIIGTCTGHPELLELDVIGEYWGMGNTPWAGVDYLKHLWTEFSLPRGVDGMVARIDRGSGKAMYGPARVNLYGIDALADCPDIDVDSVYSYWSSHWFGQVAGPRVASSLKYTREITNACYGLPTVYAFSGSVARDYLLRSLFHLDCVSVALKTTNNFQAGMLNYTALRDPLLRAASMLAVTPPTTLFGDFSPAYSAQSNPSVAIRVVDATYGLNPALFLLEYSTDGGATWPDYAGITVNAEGSGTEPYLVTTGPMPFGSPTAGRNKIRLTATNLVGTVTTSRVYTVRGLDQAYINLGTSNVSDGILHPQGSDGNTVGTTAGGRSCRQVASGNNNFFFQADEGFAYDRNPDTLYLQVDYYGSTGSITPVYDSVMKNDEALSPVYLAGGSTWRTATWRLDNVSFGHRLGLSADFRLYVGGNQDIRISSVRLYYAEPTGTLARPTNLQAAPVSTTQISLNWTAVPGATRYQVCRSSSLAGWATGTSLTDSGLSPNTQYTYTVAAHNDADYTSSAGQMAYTNTLSNAPALPTTITSAAPGSWQTSNQFTFTAVNGFGIGKVAYYHLAWDSSPTHAWTGTEASWPSVTAPTAPQWTVWRPYTSPTDNVSGWLLYEGSTTQRLMSEEIVYEDGVPSWKFVDQGRNYNTKVKIVAYPNVPFSRSTGGTMMVRMKAADSPLGWWNTNTNFGFTLPDSTETGVVVLPGSLQMRGPSASNTAQAIDNGYSYHTYTLTFQNSTWNLYRDGQYLMNLTQGASGTTDWSGPSFGQGTSDAYGAWSYQWIAWRNDGAFAPSPTNGNLVLVAPQYGTYYLHLKGFSAEDDPNGSVDIGPFHYWSGSPTAPTVTDDGAYTTRDYIHATWLEVGPSLSYEYAIGTTVGGQQVVPFTSIAAALSVERTDLTLSEGTAYYVSVRATGGPVGTSDGITVASDAQKISQSKLLSDDAPTALYSKIVTAVFPTCVYVQDTNGMGVKIATSKTLAIGNVVDIAGMMAGSAAERYIQADVVRSTGTDSIAPPVLAGKAVGGSDFSYNEATNSGQNGPQAWSGSGQRALADLLGPNNIGGLIKTSGRVTWADASSFCIDDGSSCDDYETIGLGAPAGLKVSVPQGVTPPSVGSYAVVTGISSCYELDGGLRRLILVRRQSDIWP
ncbi:MAG: fibronectin type III domain-containing protein [Armatimonadota bacterium]|nr:fibronectin type III domain-containing protein [Armatimonadota bacterium]